MRVMTTISRELRRLVAVAAAVFAALLVAQSQELRTAAQFEPVSQSNNIDRSHKGSRLTPVPLAAKATILVGCEPPFSPLVTVSSAKFSMRCLT
jgi:hypothetical protein